MICVYYLNGEFLENTVDFNVEIDVVVSEVVTDIESNIVKSIQV